MCGICGFSGDMCNYIGRDGLEKMLETIRHRGPDDEGIFISDNTALGMRRLSIIDRQSGNQPIYNEDKSICIVFNGEIYNFKSLKEYLSAKGHSFYTRSDTEVIIHLYEEFGDDFVSHLEGMFAVAIWDMRNCKLILARDRLGEKPLYYSYRNNTIVFASEIKALLSCNTINTGLNEDILGIYLMYRFIPGDQTMFKNIFKLLPGHLLTFQNNEIKIRQYWDVSFENCLDKQNEQYYSEKIKEIFRESMSKRMDGEVNLGIFVSGGLDSTILLDQASDLFDKNIKTFSIAFEKPSQNISNEEYNELNYAKMVSNYYGTQHEEFVINHADIVNDIENIIWHMDEPPSDPTSLPLYYISKYARKHVGIVLSGEGADELFAGYKIYKEPEAINKYNRLPAFLRDRIIEPLISILPLNYGKDFLRRSKLPISGRYKGVGATFRECEITKLLKGDFQRAITNDNVNSYICSIFERCKNEDDVNQMLYFDQKAWLPEDTLNKSDKMSMAHSLELRVPFLDHKLVQFTNSIPSEYKYRGNIEKYILKQAFKNSLPNFVLKRKKNGFPIPISSLLNSHYNEFALDILLSQQAVNRGYFNKSYIEKLLRNNSSNGEYVGRQVWLLLTFELWCRVFIDGLT